MMMPLKKLLKSAKFKMCANRETKIEIKYLEAKTKGKKAVQANCKGEREKIVHNNQRGNQKYNKHKIAKRMVKISQDIYLLMNSK